MTNVEVVSELQGTIVGLSVTVGDSVRVGTAIGTIESMKLHHDLLATATGTLARVHVAVGDTVRPGDAIAEIAVSGDTDNLVGPGQADAAPVDNERQDLADVVDRHLLGLDDARPDAVARRHATGRRTARENLADLIDPGTFVEYGPLAIASQRARRDHEDLVRRSPADGLVGGIASVNGDLFPGRSSKIVAMSYDYMVMAGTQGHRNHLKKDKLFEIAADLSLPVVVFAEGGGGRPGDTDTGGNSGLDGAAFRLWGQLSGRVPLVGINGGYCFAGNAAILGCCDVVIGTRDSYVGMAGPAMIEGGGLGVYAPTEIGPIEVQAANGVVDLVADDETHATDLARRYLSYFQGTIGPPAMIDPEADANNDALRHIVPTDRLRSYDLRPALDLLFDPGSVLELRAEFGRGMITALARVDGRPVGVIANNPLHLAGAIDTDGSDKAARFMQLCDAHGLAIITMVDTPGMMVGPDVEATGLVRHCSRLFVTGANLTVPMISIVLRKAYGLGAQAMMGGSTKAPLACLGWPTSEFGPMGLEGAVRLGFRAELDACGTDDARDALFQELVDQLYEQGKGLSIAEYFEIDDVIDPADTRQWLTTLLGATPARRGNRPNIDTW